MTRNALHLPTARRSHSNDGGGHRSVLSVVPADVSVVFGRWIPFGRLE